MTMYMQIAWLFLLAIPIACTQPFVKEVSLTAFSNQEKIAASLNEQPPFSLEIRLISLGAVFSSGPDFKSHVVTDGNIITGQNPASAAETAKQTIALAKKLNLNGIY